MSQKISLIVIATVLMLVTACSKGQNAMAGYWLDDNNMVTTVVAQGDGVIATRVDYTLASTIQRYMQTASYSNGVLTWTYWAPTKPGITTMSIVSYNKDKDTLLVKWSDDRGGSGQMTLTRIATPPYVP